MTIFSTGEVFVVILPAAAERFGVAYNASQFGSFVTKRQIPSGLLKDSSPPSTVFGQISVLHEVKGEKGRTEQTISQTGGQTTNLSAKSSEPRLSWGWPWPRPRPPRQRRVAPLPAVRDVFLVEDGRGKLCN